MLFPSTAFLHIQKQNSYLFGIYGHITKQHKVDNSSFLKMYFIKVQLIFSVLLSAVQQSDSVIHIYIQSFSYSFSLWFIIRCCIEFPVLYSKTLFFVYPKYTGLRLLIPVSQTIPPSFICLALGNSYKIFHYEE